MNCKRQFLKGISAVLAVTFFVSDLAYAAPTELFHSAPGPLERVLEDPSRFETPLDFAHLKEIKKGANKSLIIHIQDAHSNLSGQENLAATLNEIMTKYGVSLVLSEGGWGDCSLTQFKKIASPEIWKRVAKKYLIAGKISGEEYLNLTSDHPMKIVGLEDKELYLKSVQNYAELADRREKILEFLNRMKMAVAKLKRKTYPLELLAYEEKKEKTSGGDTPIAVEEFLKLAEGQNFDLKPFSNLEQLVALKRKEKTIDFHLADLEQAVLLEEIQGKGGGKELSGVSSAIKTSADPSFGGQFALFQKTFQIARSKNISLDKFYNLAQYLDYLKDFSAIDLDKVLNEFERAEDEFYRLKLTAGDSRLVRAIDRYLGLLFSAYKIQMTTKEFNLFRANEPDFGTLETLAFLNRKLVEEGYAEDILPLNNLLENGKIYLEAFYDSVSKRDDAFVQNAEWILAQENQKVAVLISGGYHTAHLKELLEPKGHSIAVLAPIVTSETNQEKYEKELLAPLGRNLKKLEISDGRIKTGQINSDGVRTMLLMVSGNLNRILEEVKPGSSSADAIVGQTALEFKPKTTPGVESGSPADSLAAARAVLEKSLKRPISDNLRTGSGARLAGEFSGALEKVRMSGYQDFSPLSDLSLYFGENHSLASQWLTTIRSLAEYFSSAHFEGPYAEALKAKALVEQMNIRWYFLRNELLFSSQGLAGSNPTDYFNSLTVGNILHRATYPLGSEGGRINFYSVGLKEPRAYSHLAFRSGSDIVYVVSRVMDRVQYHEDLTRMHEGMKRSDQVLTQVYSRLFSLLKQRLKNGLWPAYFHMILMEEFRHAFDDYEVKARLNKSDPSRTDEYRDMFVNAHFRPGHVLYKIWKNADNPDLKRLLAESYIELTAQMTSAAMSRDPLLRLLRWMGFAIELNRKKIGGDAYFLMTGLVMRLIGDELEMTSKDTPIDETNYRRFDAFQIVRIVEKMMQTPPDQLRLAIKRAADKLLIFPVDSGVFPTIGDTGQLTPKQGDELPSEKLIQKLGGFPEAAARLASVSEEARALVREAKVLLKQSYNSVDAFDVMLKPLEIKASGLLRSKSLPDKLRENLQAVKGGIKEYRTLLKRADHVLEYEYKTIGSFERAQETLIKNFKSHWPGKVPVLEELEEKIRKRRGVYYGKARAKEFVSAKNLVMDAKNLDELRDALKIYEAAKDTLLYRWSASYSGLARGADTDLNTARMRLEADRDLRLSDLRYRMREQKKKVFRTFDVEFFAESKKKYQALATEYKKLRSSGGDPPLKMAEDKMVEDWKEIQGLEYALDIENKTRLLRLFTRLKTMRRIALKTNDIKTFETAQRRFNVALGQFGRLNSGKLPDGVLQAQAALDRKKESLVRKSAPNPGWSARVLIALRERSFVFLARVRDRFWVGRVEKYGGAFLKQISSGLRLSGARLAGISPNISMRTSKGRLEEVDRYLAGFIKGAFSDRKEVSFLEIGTGWPIVVPPETAKTLNRLTGKRIQITAMDILKPAKAIRFKESQEISEILIDSQGEVLMISAVGLESTEWLTQTGLKERGLGLSVQRLMDGIHSGTIPADAYETEDDPWKKAAGRNLNFVQGDYRDSNPGVEPADIVRIFNVDGPIDRAALARLTKDGGYAAIGYSPFLRSDDLRLINKFTIYQKINGQLMPLRHVFSGQFIYGGAALSRWIDQYRYNNRSVIGFGKDEWPHSRGINDLLDQEIINRAMANAYHRLESRVNSDLKVWFQKAVARWLPEKIKKENRYLLSGSHALGLLTRMDDFLRGREGSKDGWLDRLRLKYLSWKIERRMNELTQLWLQEAAGELNQEKQIQARFLPKLNSIEIITGARLAGHAEITRRQFLIIGLSGLGLAGAAVSAWVWSSRPKPDQNNVVQEPQTRPQEIVDLRQDLVHLIFSYHGKEKDFEYTQLNFQSAVNTALEKGRDVHLILEGPALSRFAKAYAIYQALDPKKKDNLSDIFGEGLYEGLPEELDLLMSGDIRELPYLNGWTIYDAYDYLLHRTDGGGSGNQEKIDQSQHILFILQKIETILDDLVDGKRPPVSSGVTRAKALERIQKVFEGYLDSMDEAYNRHQPLPLPSRFFLGAQTSGFFRAQLDFIRRWESQRVFIHNERLTDPKALREHETLGMISDILTPRAYKYYKDLNTDYYLPSIFFHGKGNTVIGPIDPVRRLSSTNEKSSDNRRLRALDYILEFVRKEYRMDFVLRDESVRDLMGVILKNPNAAVVVTRGIHHKISLRDLAVTAFGDKSVQVSEGLITEETAALENIQEGRRLSPKDQMLLYEEEKPSETAIHWAERTLTRSLSRFLIHQSYYTALLLKNGFVPEAFTDDQIKENESYLYKGDQRFLDHPELADPFLKDALRLYGLYRSGMEALAKKNNIPSELIGFEDRNDEGMIYSIYYALRKNGLLEPAEMKSIHDAISEIEKGQRLNLEKWPDVIQFLKIFKADADPSAARLAVRKEAEFNKIPIGQIEGSRTLSYLARTYNQTKMLPLIYQDTQSKRYYFALKNGAVNSVEKGPTRAALYSHAAKAGFENVVEAIEIENGVFLTRILQSIPDDEVKSAKTRVEDVFLYMVYFLDTDHQIGVMHNVSYRFINGEKRYLIYDTGNSRADLSSIGVKELTSKDRDKIVSAFEKVSLDEEYLRERIAALKISDVERQFMTSELNAILKLRAAETKLEADGARLAGLSAVAAERIATTLQTNRRSDLFSTDWRSQAKSASADPYTPIDDLSDYVLVYNSLGNLKKPSPRELPRIYTYRLDATRVLTVDRNQFLYAENLPADLRLGSDSIYYCTVFGVRAQRPDEAPRFLLAHAQSLRAATDLGFPKRTASALVDFLKKQNYLESQIEIVVFVHRENTTELLQTDSYAKLTKSRVKLTIVELDKEAMDSNVVVMGPDGISSVAVSPRTTRQGEKEILKDANGRPYKVNYQWGLGLEGEPIGAKVIPISAARLATSRDLSGMDFKDFLKGRLDSKTRSPMIPKPLYLYAQEHNWIISLEEAGRDLGMQDDEIRLFAELPADEKTPKLLVFDKKSQRERFSKLMEIAVTAGGGTSIRELKVGLDKVQNGGTLPDDYRSSEKSSRGKLFWEAFDEQSLQKSLEAFNHNQRIKRGVMVAILDHRLLERERAAVQALEYLGGYAAPGKLVTPVKGKRPYPTFSSAPMAYLALSGLDYERINYNRDIFGKLPLFTGNTGVKSGDEAVHADGIVFMRKLEDWVDGRGGVTTVPDLAKGIHREVSVLYRTLNQKGFRKLFQHINRWRASEGLYPLQIVIYFATQSSKNAEARKIFQLDAAKFDPPRSPLGRHFSQALRLYGSKSPGYASLKDFTLKKLWDIWKGRPKLPESLVDLVLNEIIENAPSPGTEGGPLTRVFPVLYYYRVTVPRALNVAKPALLSDYFIGFRSVLKQSTHNQFPLVLPREDTAARELSKAAEDLEKKIDDAKKRMEQIFQREFKTRNPKDSFPKGKRFFELDELRSAGIYTSIPELALRPVNGLKLLKSATENNRYLEDNLKLAFIRRLDLAEDLLTQNEEFKSAAAEYQQALYALQNGELSISAARLAASRDLSGMDLKDFLAPYLAVGNGRAVDIGGAEEFLPKIAKYLDDRGLSFAEGYMLSGKKMRRILQGQSDPSEPSRYASEIVYQNSYANQIVKSNNDALGKFSILFSNAPQLNSGFAGRRDFAENIQNLAAPGAYLFIRLHTDDITSGRIVPFMALLETGSADRTFQLEAVYDTLPAGYIKTPYTERSAVPLLVFHQRGPLSDAERQTLTNSLEEIKEHGLDYNAKKIASEILSRSSAARLASTAGSVLPPAAQRAEEARGPNTFEETFGNRSKEILAYLIDAGEPVDLRKINNFKRVDEKVSERDFLKKTIWRLTDHYELDYGGKPLQFDVTYYDAGKEDKVKTRDLLLREIEIANLAHEAGVAPAVIRVNGGDDVLMVTKFIRGAAADTIKFDANGIEAIGNLIGRMHQKGIVHNDLTHPEYMELRPGNILVTRNEPPYAMQVVDFEYAKLEENSTDLRQREVQRLIAALQRHVLREVTPAMVSERFLRGYEAVHRESEINFQKFFGVRLAQGTARRVNDIDDETQMFLAVAAKGSRQLPTDVIVSFAGLNQNVVGKFTIGGFALYHPEGGYFVPTGTLSFSPAIQAKADAFMPRARLVSRVEAKEGTALMDPKVLEAKKEDERLARLAARLYDKEIGNRDVILKIVTAKRLDESEIGLYLKRFETLRQIVGENNVYLQFVELSDNNQPTVYGASDNIEKLAGKDHGVVYFSTPSQIMLDSAMKEGAGFAAFDAIGEGAIVPFLADAVFAVGTARMDKPSPWLEQLWRSLRLDPFEELSPENFKAIKTVTNPNVSLYQKLRLKIIAKIAWNQFLEYVKEVAKTQLAIGAAA